MGVTNHLLSGIILQVPSPCLPPGPQEQYGRIRGENSGTMMRPGYFLGFSTHYVIENPTGTKLAEKINPGYLGSIILKDLGSLNKTETGNNFFVEPLG